MCLDVLDSPLIQVGKGTLAVGQFASNRDAFEAVDVPKFLAQLVAAGKLSHELRRRFETRLQDATSGFDHSHLAHELRRIGALTSFQALRLANGRTDELVLGGHLLLESLGQGAMGAVYRALHIASDVERAIKVVRSTGSTSRSMLERLRHEAGILQQLRHPHIVAMHEAEAREEFFYLAMEYIVGRSLEREVARRGPLDVRSAISYTLQAARGLSSVHEHRIVHRDVKPNNLMLSDLGEVKLIDFGLAMRLGATTLESGNRSESVRFGGTSTFLGSVNFLAPEQATDPHSVDERADIYGLGCTLFYLMTGQAPFDVGDRATRLFAHRNAPVPRLQMARPDVPVALDELCARMMAKSVDDRPRVMWEVIEALEACQTALVSNSYDDTEIIETAPLHHLPLELEPMNEDTLPLSAGKASEVARRSPAIERTAPERRQSASASAASSVLVAGVVLAIMVVMPRIWWGTEAPSEIAGGDIVDSATALDEEASSSDGIDLLEVIDLERNVLWGSPWQRMGTEILTGVGRPGVLELPVDVPTEYELEMVVTRRDPRGPLVIGVVFGESCGVVVLDKEDDSGEGWGGLGVDADQRMLATTDHPWLDRNEERHVRVTVKRSLVEVTCDQATVLRYEGDLSEVTRGPLWSQADARCLFVGTEEAAFAIHRFHLLPEPDIQTALAESE